MANSVKKCEAKDCDINALCKVRVKGTDRVVHLCYHHDGFKNQITLRDGSKFNPNNGQLTNN